QVDAVALGPGGLLELQPPELDVEFVARAFQLGQLGEQLAVLMAGEHHGHAAADVGQDQQRDEDAGGHAATCRRSATRSTALRARGFTASSASPALRAPPMARSVGVN